MHDGISGVRHFHDLAEMSGAAAAEVGRILHECVYGQGIASVVLAGGTTPRVLYELLAHEPYKSDLPWEAVHLFWGDERYVPHTDPASNYRMVREVLLNRIAIPAANIHPIDTALTSAEVAATDYEDDIRAFFRERRIEPLFDLALLGIGADGHTASLFPGDPALAEQSRWAVPVTAPAGFVPLSRITLTYNALTSVHHALLLAARPGKEAVLSAIEHGERSVPAGKIASQTSTYLYIADNR